MAPGIRCKVTALVSIQKNSTGPALLVEAGMGRVHSRIAKACDRLALSADPAECTAIRSYPFAKRSIPRSALAGRWPWQDQAPPVLMTSYVRDRTLGPAVRFGTSPRDKPGGCHTAQRTKRKDTELALFDKVLVTALDQASNGNRAKASAHRRHATKRTPDPFRLF